MVGLMECGLMDIVSVAILSGVFGGLVGIFVTLVGVKIQKGIEQRSADYHHRYRREAEAQKQARGREEEEGEDWLDW